MELSNSNNGGLSRLNPGRSNSITKALGKKLGTLVPVLGKPALDFLGATNAIATGRETEFVGNPKKTVSPSRR
jgi:hypothetical protein